MENEKDDFFEKIPEEKPKKEKPPKKPVYKEDDPRYYEQEESKWEHLKPTRFQRNRYVYYGAMLLIVFMLAYGLYIYFFTPVIDKADAYGYVENVERHGQFFQTFEGTVIPYKSITDTTRIYDGDFKFSTPNEKIATTLKNKQETGEPVKLSYRVYRYKFPWRGATKTIVVGVDSVDASKLLPPERR